MAEARALVAPEKAVAHFLAVKAKTLASRARHLVALNAEDVGLRPGDRAHAPQPEHFAANSVH